MGASKSLEYVLCSSDRLLPSLLSFRSSGPSASHLGFFALPPGVPLERSETSGEEDLCER